MKKRLVYLILLFAITAVAVMYGISKRGHLALSTDGGFAFSFIGKGDTEVSERTDSDGPIEDRRHLYPLHTSTAIRLSSDVPQVRKRHPPGERSQSPSRPATGS